MTTTAQTPDVDTLMGAIARMADRMAASCHRSGLAHINGGDPRKLLRDSERQRKSLHRLMDALTRAQSERYSSWHFRYTIATIADHKRAMAKEG